MTIEFRDRQHLILVSPPLLLPVTFQENVVTLPTEYPLARASILQAIDFSLAITAFEASRTKGLLFSNNHTVLNLSAAITTFIHTITTEE
jgi:hypothetical protein